MPILIVGPMIPHDHVRPCTFRFYTEVHCDERNHWRGKYVRAVMMMIFGRESVAIHIQER